MPRILSKRIFNRVVDIEGLPNELRERILSNFTINELMAVECLSTRWQGHVSRVLMEIKVLTVLFRGQRTFSHFEDLVSPDFQCGIREHSPMTTIMTRDDEGRDQVIKLISRMTNLVAVGLPVHWQSQSLMAALKNCPKLEHLALSQKGIRYDPLKTVMSNELCSKLTCLSTVNKMSYKTIKKMTSLERYSNKPDKLRLDQLTFLLKNGLVSLSGKIEYKDFKTVCQLGTRLETLDVIFIVVSHRGFHLQEFGLDDVRQIVLNLRRLKKLRINVVSMDCLLLLKDMNNLEDLTIYRVGEDDFECDVFKDAMKLFGHRLKALRIENLQSKRVIADVAVECPNLESFVVNNDYCKAGPMDSESADLRKMSKLQVLKYDFGRWNRWKNEEVVELLDGLPKLRKLEAKFWRYAVENFKNFPLLAASKFPHLVVEVVDGPETLAKL